MILIMLNARLRCLSEPDEVKVAMAASSNPVFSCRLLGPPVDGEQGLLYRSMGEPWVAGRIQGQGQNTTVQELWRSDNEPDLETVTTALSGMKRL